MKVAFLVLDGVTQAVLTGETEAERAIVRALADRAGDIRAYRAGFEVAPTHAGWLQGFKPTHESLILVVRPKEAGTVKAEGE